MSPRSWIVTLIVLLVASNGYWLLRGIDSGITATYRAASYDSMAKGYDQAIRLANLNLLGLSADEAIAKIGLDVSGSEPFEKEGCIYVSQVCVRLGEERTVVGFSAPPNGP